MNGMPETTLAVLCLLWRKDLDNLEVYRTILIQQPQYLGEKPSEYVEYCFTPGQTKTKSSIVGGIS